MDKKKLRLAVFFLLLVGSNFFFFILVSLWGVLIWAYTLGVWTQVIEEVSLPLFAIGMIFIAFQTLFVGKYAIGLDCYIIRNRKNREWLKQI